MNEEQVDAVAKVLAKWNPLGAAAKEAPDLDGYRIEAGDIIFPWRSPELTRSCSPGLTHCPGLPRRM